jgi:hypothetical protein
MLVRGRIALQTELLRLFCARSRRLGSGCYDSDARRSVHRSRGVDARVPIGEHPMLFAQSAHPRFALAPGRVGSPWVAFAIPDCRNSLPAVIISRTEIGRRIVRVLTRVVVEE